MLCQLARPLGLTRVTTLFQQRSMTFPWSKTWISMTYRHSKKFQNIIIIFHDFPWPWLFSMTFQAWKMVLLNSMTFQEEWSPCLTNCDTINFHAYKLQTTNSLHGVFEVRKIVEAHGHSSGGNWRPVDLEKTLHSADVDEVDGKPFVTQQSRQVLSITQTHCMHTESFNTSEDDG